MDTKLEPKKQNHGEPRAFFLSLLFYHFPGQVA